MDPANDMASAYEWSRGGVSCLKVGAEKKIAAIRRKMDRYPCGECGESPCADDCEC